MNTPTHLLMGATFFGARDDARITGFAVAGSMIPDLSMYLMIAWARFVQGHSPRYIFDTLYFSETWQSVFAVDNSFVLWTAVLVISLLAKFAVGIAASGGALAHIVFDFLLHHDDARRHFWPVSDWVFNSPVSYWDNDHYGNIVGPIETALCVVMLIVLLRRHTEVMPRLGIGVLGLAAIAPSLIWRFVF